MAKQPPTPAKKEEREAKECPLCRVHAENRSRFYAKPAEIGKMIRKDDIWWFCPVCQTKVR